MAKIIKKSQSFPDLPKKDTDRLIAERTMIRQTRAQLAVQIRKINKELAKIASL